MVEPNFLENQIWTRKKILYIGNSVNIYAIMMMAIGKEKTVHQYKNSRTLITSKRLIMVKYIYPRSSPSYTQ